MTINNSIMSYQYRGPWGDPKYRGNCSGFVIKDLLEFYFPNQKLFQFIEVFSGSGTGKEVAESLGIFNSIHLDLNNGWNALNDEIPKKADFIFSHPPYWDIVNYQSIRNDKNEEDLSSIKDYDTFIKQLNAINLKIYEALNEGGIHAILIGDVRKNKKYYSIQKDMEWYGALLSHIIKIQHNTLKSNFSYSGKFIPIAHEHLLIFKKVN